jgi:hypothetical protein
MERGNEQDDDQRHGGDDRIAPGGADLHAVRRPNSPCGRNTRIRIITA